jgi:hypothetical protein
MPGQHAAQKITWPGPIEVQHGLDGQLQRAHGTGQRQIHDPEAKKIEKKSNVDEASCVLRRVSSSTAMTEARDEFFSA